MRVKQCHPFYFVHTLGFFTFLSSREWQQHSGSATPSRLWTKLNKHLVHPSEEVEHDIWGWRRDHEVESYAAWGYRTWAGVFWVRLSLSPLSPLQLHGVTTICLRFSSWCQLFWLSRAARLQVEVLRTSPARRRWCRGSHLCPCSENKPPPCWRTCTTCFSQPPGGTGPGWSPVRSYF